MKLFKELALRYNNIYICKDLLVDGLLLNHKINSLYLRNMQEDRKIPVSKTLDKICEDILNRKYLTLEDMVKSFRAKT